MSYNANDKFWTQRVHKEENRIFRDIKSRGEVEALRDAERLSNFSSYHGINVSLDKDSKKLLKGLNLCLKKKERKDKKLKIM